MDTPSCLQIQWLPDLTTLVAPGPVSDRARLISSFTIVSELFNIEGIDTKDFE